ncbi:hydantoinase/oxoprolinase family protein [Paenibacillus naphthalenovorans]|uniref:hydantoinase/oxoprolinase family protein n=2 Tax=Paenibacillus naphthalenovorans TaxID=162209 RepID=UPI0010BA2312|nr:hydantoinase/oxoprolinase family protein [Paenibacillus naphthalenovorans]GCL74171.1 hydantoinase/oxoprolinase family protein [Paenibacillus naphthalenovorans]
MTYRIFIDIGGTFADCVVIHQQGIVSSKRPSAHNRIGEVLVKALRECADELRIDLSELLSSTEEIGYASTAALNQLVARQGPKIGLLTTTGAEDAIYIGMGAQWIDGVRDIERESLLPKARKPSPLIPRELSVGILERMDSRGNVIRPLDEEMVREQVSRLVEEGVQGFIVSFLWSFLNPSHELRVREIIKEEFPDHLYALPVVLSSESASVRGEYQRTMTAVINLFLMENMRFQMYSVIEELRKHGFRGQISLVQNNAGLADVWSTAPVSVFKGGPAAGLIGATNLMKKYGENIITTDMGGTTFDVGVISAGEPMTSELRPVIDRWLIGANMLEVTSIGAGSGTIFQVNLERNGQLEAMPQSAGSVPGPAAYDLGASDPTLLDADLILGYLDPDTFAGGKRKLNRDRAYRCINERIARPLGISVIDAAARMRRMANDLMGHTLLKETLMRGFDPREFTVFAYGGAGPTHCCDYTRVLDPKRIVTFPFSPVFCAIASSLLSHSLTLSKSKPFLLMYPGQQWPDHFDAFNAAVKELQALAYQNLGTKSVNRGDLEFTLELDMKFGGQVHVKRIVSPLLRIESVKDADLIYATFIESYKRRFSPFSLNVEGGVIIEAFTLHASIPREAAELPTFPPASSGPSRALKGRRDVFWIYEKQWMSTPIYSFDLLSAGNLLEGPAIAEGAYTTYVIPLGYRFSLDRHKAGIIEKA